jgi:hypothetical protein
MRSTANQNVTGIVSTTIQTRTGECEGLLPCTLHEGRAGLGGDLLESTGAGLSTLQRHVMSNGLRSRTQADVHELLVRIQHQTPGTVIGPNGPRLAGSGHELQLDSTTAVSIAASAAARRFLQSLRPKSPAEPTAINWASGVGATGPPMPPAPMAESGTGTVSHDVTANQLRQADQWVEQHAQHSAFTPTVQLHASQLSQRFVNRPRSLAVVEDGAAAPISAAGGSSTVSTPALVHTSSSAVVAATAVRCAGQAQHFFRGVLAARQRRQRTLTNSAAFQSIAVPGMALR